MPRQNINYENTIMYKFVCNDLNITDTYAGHTTEFTKRKWGHKTCCHNKNSKNHNLKIYQTIRENGGWANWSMIEIEKYQCVDGNEAGARERYWYEQLNANMNMQTPNRSQKEYQNDKKDIISEYKKQYDNDNKKILSENNKQYRNDNKEILVVKHKQYYDENKDKICKNNKLTCGCECGSTCRIRDKSRHIKSIKHITYINSMNSEKNNI